MNQGWRKPLLVRIVLLQQALDNLILATPTGDTRNSLTEANIYIMDAIEHLRSTAKEKV